VNVPLILAGCLAVLGVGLHGAGGEVLVVRKLASTPLPSTSFGGPAMTRMMIHASWHIVTIAFLTVGSGLLLAGTVLNGDVAEAVALVCAGAATGFAAVVIGLGVAHTGSPRLLFRHPGPAVLTLTAALAWWGALTV
jgi:hypothetical protein